ncbi:MAG: SDR family NAD(P)-dependent oxidoreductase [Terriglobia bacterium]
MKSPGQLQDQVALVTGASGEIGTAIALALLRAGANVVWTGRNLRRLTGLSGLTGRARSLGIDAGRSLLVRADVRVERDVRSTVQAAIKRFGHVDILVNNAGARGPTAPLTQIKLKEWRDVVETNLTGAFLFSRECLRHMTRRRRGRIINISTVVSHWGYPLRAPYAASKAALNSLTLTLAQEAGRLGVQVNAVCPGPVAGKALERVIQSRAKTMRVPLKTMRKQFLRPAALGRAVTAEDVARAVLFLCSEAARNITGQIIDVSAGYGLWPGT